MATTVKVPIVGSRIEIQFPEYCIYCCDLATTHKETEVKTEHHRYLGRKRTLVTGHKVVFRIPYCDQHIKAAKTVETLTNISLVIFGIPGALMGLKYALNDPFWWGLYVIYPLIGFLVGGVVGVLLFQIVFQPILSIFIKTVRHTPNAFFFSIRRSDFSGGSAEGTSLGFQTWFPTEGNHIMLRFTSSLYATKFVEANPGASVK